MGLVEEVSTLINSEAVNYVVGEVVASAPASDDRLSKELGALAALCRGQTAAIRLLARELDVLKASGGDQDVQG